MAAITSSCEAKNPQGDSAMEIDMALSDFFTIS